MAAVKLPDELVEAAREGRLVLFLGAGASLGASDDQGKKMPDANGLRDAIVQKFLLPRHSSLSLRPAYDLACSRRSVRDLQKFMHDTLDGFQPTPEHLLVPTIPWAGIATTNYDLLVERAFKASGGGGRLSVHARDGEATLDTIPSSSTIYLKLHGCINDYENITAPLITSTEQIIEHQNHRGNLFKTFLEWGQSYSVAVVGYGMDDGDMRQLFHTLINERDGRPRHFLVRPGWDDYLADYWKERRFEPVEGDFASFVTALHGAVPTGLADLGALARQERQTSITKFIAHFGVRESDDLVAALETTFEHVVPGQSYTGNARAFYEGVNQGWYPVEHGLDVQRTVTRQALRRWVIPAREGKSPKFCLIKGHAGSGKSTSLRRIAWEAALTYERFVLYLRPGAKINVDVLEEMARLTSLPIFLFVDEAGEHASDIRFILQKGGVKSWPITIIAAERLNEWNAVEVEEDIIPHEELQIEYLSVAEIEELVLLLEEHKSLGELAKISIDERVRRLRDVAGRQLLVALHEATRGGNFEDILESEFDGIPSAEARALYLDICALHRLGPPVRAGLISRLHGISFHEFGERFFKPLEQVVITAERKYGGDFHYQARHNYIAQIVFERAARTPAHKQEILLRIIDKLNTDYSYDQIVLRQLISGRTIAEMLPDRIMGEAIYDAAERNVGRTTLVLHQRALYEMRMSGDQAGLERAEQLVKEALELEPRSPVLRHTLAELAFKRSTLARSPEEAAVFRSEAVSIARKLAADGRTSHPHHTLAKVALANLDQALDEENLKPSNLATQAVSNAIQEAENVLRTGLSRFPNEPYLLTAEASLAIKLRHADRALVALERAFELNPKAELSASKLSLLYLARGDESKAAQTLRRALDVNPGSKVLNLRYARVLALQNPELEWQSPETLLHYLKRGLSHGSANVDSQFWYARQLALDGQDAESRAVFDKIVRAKHPARLSRDPAIVFEAKTEPKIFTGQVSVLEPDFGFIYQTTPSLTVFFRRLGPLLEPGLNIGTRVRYKLTFNHRGPLAYDVEWMN